MKQVYDYRIVEHFSWGEGWDSGYNPICIRRDVAPFPGVADSRTVSIPSSEQRTLVKGNHKTALPFTGTYVESVPISGTWTYQVREAPGISVTCGEKIGSHLVWGGDGGYFIDLPRSAPAPDVPSWVVDIATTKALSSLRSSYMNLPLLFAERKETINLIASKGRILARGIGDQQRKSLARWYKTRKADRKRVARDIANEHLAFLFGVLPLVSEVEGLMTLLSEDKSKVLTGRGRMASVSTEQDYISSPPNASGASGYPIYNGSIEHVTRLSCRVSITVDVSLEAMATARKLGFNPLATAYDLVPLSFLLGFVSNIGEFLRAYDPLVGATFKTGCTSTWAERSSHLTANAGSRTWQYTPTWYRKVQGSGTVSGSIRTLKVVRTPLAGFPDPSFHLVNNLSFGKAATIAALAVQRYVKPARSLLKQRAFRYKGPRPKWLPPIRYR